MAEAYPPKLSLFPKTPNWRHTSSPESLNLSSESMIRFFHRKIKTNTAIKSYAWFCCMCSLSCSLHLLSPLVFTATTFEISFFKAPERQYPTFEKVRVRSFRSTKNSKPFLKFFFAPCVKFLSMLRCMILMFYYLIFYSI